jgi:hypothetical protein
MSTTPHPGRANAPRRASGTVVASDSQMMRAEPAKSRECRGECCTGHHRPTAGDDEPDCGWSQREGPGHEDEGHWGRDREREVAGPAGDSSRAKDVVLENVRKARRDLTAQPRRLGRYRNRGFPGTDRQQRDGRNGEPDGLDEDHARGADKCHQCPTHTRSDDLTGSPDELDRRVSREHSIGTDH